MNLTNTLLSCLALCILTIVPVQHASANNDTGLRSLIVYSNTDTGPDEHVYLLDQLVSHYSATEIKTAAEATGLSAYDAIFYVGIAEEQLPASFISDVSEFDGPMMLFGKNINQFQDRIKVTTTGNTVDIIEIGFPGEAERNTFATTKEIQAIKLTEDVETIVEGWRGNVAYPMLVTNGNDYYLATSQLGDITMYEVTDVLPEMFAFNRSTQKSVFLTIKDIHPATNIEALTQLTAYLIADDIPIILAISPAYTDPETGEVRHFSETTELVTNIKALQQMGSTIIYSYPMLPAQTSAEQKRKTVESEIQELASFGIHPVAVTFPSQMDGVSEEDLNIVSSYFSTVISEAKPVNTTLFKYAAPYVTKPSYLNGMVWIPETLGYVSTDSTSGLLETKGRINQLDSVAGATLGLTVPAYMQVDRVEEVMQMFEDVPNTTWLNLHEQDLSVDVPDVTIGVDTQGLVTVESEIPRLRAFMYQYQLSYLEIALWLMAAVVVIFIVAFLAYSFQLKLRLRKALFSERSRHG